MQPSDMMLLVPSQTVQKHGWYTAVRDGSNGPVGEPVLPYGQSKGIGVRTAAWSTAATAGCRRRLKTNCR
jgi:hypothetical protein